VANGTTDIFLGPIPTELLSVPAGSPHTISMHVNSVPSACTAPEGPGSCTFQYDLASTPNITGFSPSTLDFENATTAELSITGSGFNANITRNRVMLGSTPCNITAASETSIVCFVDDSTPGGMRELQVYVENLGFAAPNNQEVQVRAAFVLDVEPKILHANAAAAQPTLTMVTVTGKVGAADLACWELLVVSKL